MSAETKRGEYQGSVLTQAILRGWSAGHVSWATSSRLTPGLLIRSGSGASALSCTRTGMLTHLPSITWGSTLSAAFASSKRGKGS